MATVLAKLSQVHIRILSRRLAVKRPFMKLLAQELTFAHLCLGLLACGCLIGAGYSVHKICYQFMTSPLATSVRTVKTDTLVLPEIAVCPMIPLNIKKLQENRFDSDEIDTMMYQFTHESLVLFKKNVKKVSQDAGLRSKLTGVNWHEFVVNNSLQCREVLELCVFGRKAVDCCSVSVPIMNEKRGLCHKFNSLDPQQFATLNDGLVILVRVPETSWGKVLEKGIELNYGRKIGYPFTPNEPKDFQNLFVESRKSVLIDLQMIKIVRLDSDTCLSDDREPMCVGCWNRGVRKYCNCTLLGFSDPETEDLSICNPVEFVECEHAMEPKIKEQHHPCILKNCKQRCIEYRYSALLSYTVLNDDYVYDLLGATNSSVEYTLIRMYYSAMNFYVVEEFNVITFHNVISQIGGITGIWLGFSILHIVRALRELYKVYKQKKSAPKKLTQNRISAKSDLGGKY